MTVPQAGDTFIRQAFWLVLARAPSDTELSDQRRSFIPGSERALVLRLLSSPEFRLVHHGWKTGAGIDKDPSAHEAGLQTLGSNDAFVRAAYRHLFDRDADAGGLAHYADALARGLARADLIRTFVLSDEFARRYEDIAPGGGFVPRDVQLCELANPAKWDNPDWIALLHSLGTLSDHKLAMHRKSYELTQLLFGLERLGLVRDDVRVVSIGAGHEPVLYWLANRVRQVIATDLYEGRWQSESGQEGDAGVLSRPDAYAPFAYRRDRLTYMRMDGRRLAFQDGSFDVAYSLSSIEHFGGTAGARAAIVEMTRVVRRGGVVIVATEYQLSGPPHPEAFSPDQVREVLTAGGLELVEPIDEMVWQRYAHTVVDLMRNRYQTPHMVVGDKGAAITSVMAFLRKPGM